MGMPGAITSVPSTTTTICFLHQLRLANRASATLIAQSTTVSTDFFDEQKFVETAAARARTGAEIVKRSFREQYSEDAAQALTYTDRNPERAWA